MQCAHCFVRNIIPWNLPNLLSLFLFEFLQKLPQVSPGRDSCEELKGHSGRFVLLLAKKKKEKKKLARRCVSHEFLMRMGIAN